MSPAVATTPKRYSIKEYLAREELATDKHEYDNGEILAMSGSTFVHSQIGINLSRETSTRLMGKPCQPLNSNIKVRLNAAGKYVYPDVTIFCGSPKFDLDDPNQTTITNPSVIIEILSQSTELYDRGKKFEGYRTLPTLKEYVLVSQWEASVETFMRHEDGRWTITSFSGMDSVLKLPSLDIEVPLNKIYLNVVFQPRKTTIEE